MTVQYEWLVEEWDTDDIMEVHHFDELTELIMFTNRYLGGLRLRIGLTRDVGSEAEGLIDRSWAYVVNKQLPERFHYSPDEPGFLVPRKFHTELRNQALVIPTEA